MLEQISVCFICSLKTETFQICFCLVAGNPLWLTAKFLHKLQQIWRGHSIIVFTEPSIPFLLSTWTFGVTARRWLAKVLPSWQLCSRDDKLHGKNRASGWPVPVKTALGTTFPSIVASASWTSVENIPIHKAISTAFQGYSWVPVPDLSLKLQRGQG